jgi:hypothetical protein
MSTAIGYVKLKGTCQKCKAASKKDPGSCDPLIEKGALFFSKNFEARPYQVYHPSTRQESPPSPSCPSS